VKDLFLDTSYLLALELANDEHHEVVLRHWQSLVRSLPRLVTTTYILSEVVTYLSSRGHHSKAVSVGNMLLQSSIVDLVHVDEGLFREGWAYFQQHEDKDYSLTDCISFVLMRKRGLDTALTLDTHFVQAGLGGLPRRDRM
jgi:predicted nucleic acid-binding protein